MQAAWPAQLALSALRRARRADASSNERESGTPAESSATKRRLAVAALASSEMPARRVTTSAISEPLASEAPRAIASESVSNAIGRCYLSANLARDGRFAAATEPL